MHKRFVLGEVTEDEERLVDGRGRGYRFAADLPLNASHPDIRVNMIEYWEVDKVDPEKVTLNISWITDHQGGRLRDRASRQNALESRWS